MACAKHLAEGAAVYELAKGDVWDAVISHRAAKESGASPETVGRRNTMTPSITNSASVCVW